MTYEEQIENLTGLSVSASGDPNQSELSQLLTDGIRDVINRIKMVNPSVMNLFTSTASDGGSGIMIDGEIIDDFIEVIICIYRYFNPLFNRYYLES